MEGRRSARSEYFLRRAPRSRPSTTRKLPGDGLLVYHVDDAIEGNDDEHHPQVKLIEADGLTHLKDGTNRGDAGDPFPGTSNNANFTATTMPNSLAYSGLETCVSLTTIVKSGTSIKAKVSVSCPLHVAPRRRSRRRGRRRLRARRRRRRRRSR